MLLVCKPNLSEEAFRTLERRLQELPYPLRWARRGERLVFLLERARGDQADLKELVEDPSVDFVLRNPSEAEITRIFSRRDLLNVALASTGVLTAGLILGPTALYAVAPSAPRSSRGDLYVGRVEEFEVNEARTQLIEGREYLIIRRDETRFFALTATCTHSDACLVEWDRKRQRLLCPCHHGIFDIQGNVVSGPPPRPLASRPVVVREGQVYVRGRQA